MLPILEIVLCPSIWKLKWILLKRYALQLYAVKVQGEVMLLISLKFVVLKMFFLHQLTQHALTLQIL